MFMKYEHLQNEFVILYTKIREIRLLCVLQTKICLRLLHYAIKVEIIFIWIIETQTILFYLLSH